jgi:MFS family permease
VSSSSVLRALAHAPFRVYFAGQAVSILGTWIQQVALSWLVYRLTGSSLLLGVTAFCALIPQLVVGPLAGAWIDRQNKRLWLMGVQCVLAAQAFVLAALTWRGVITPPVIVAMSLLLGLLNSFDTPLRQSLIASFVGRREDLPNALALNAMLFNTGRFIGPPIAGLLVGLTSEAACFALNGLSFAGLIIGMAWLRGVEPARASGSMGQVFREGLAYAWHTWTVRMLIVTLATLNITASAYAVLLPVFAREVFAGDARTLGWLWGAAGAGALASTLVLASRRSVPGLVTAVLGGVVVAAACLAAFALTHTLAFALPAMAGVGFGISVTNVGTNMLLQSMAPEALRGRVVSFFSSTRFGFDALGGLLAGALAARFGPGPTLLGEAAVLAVAIGYLWTLRRRMIGDVREAERAGQSRVS